MLINSPQSTTNLLNSTFVSRQFPLAGDGTEQNKLKLSSAGLSSGQTWAWDGTQWVATNTAGGSALPSQTGQSGKFLTTNGTVASWAAVNSAVWGNITGTLSAQTDLNTALGLKADLTSPSFTTPTLGVASATTINKVTLTAPATGSTLTIADGKVLTASNTLTFTGTDASSIAFGSGGTVAYQNQANTFTQSITTGTGNFVGVNTNNSSFYSITDNGTRSSGNLYLIYDTDNTGAESLIFGRGSAAFGSIATHLTLNSTGTALFTPANSTITTGTANPFIQTSTFAAGAGSANFRPISINYTLNTSGAQTGTATGIFLNATETALNGMTHNLMDLQVGGTSRFKVNNAGFVGIGNVTPLTSLHIKASPVASRGQLQIENVTSGNNVEMNFYDSDGTRLFLIFTNKTTAGITTSNSQPLSITANTSFANASAASAPALTTTGTWFTGGSNVTTQPHVLISGPGATNFWNTAGTGLGINASSTFTGDLFSARLDGSSRFTISSSQVNVGILLSAFNGFNSTGANTLSYTSIASTPAVSASGSWFTGGTSTTTKPHVLIEASGATSTGWNTSGTGFGINSVSGFTGNLMDLQLNGASRFSVTSGGNTIANGSVTGLSFVNSSTGGYGFTSRSNIASSADGNVVLYNNAFNNFGLLQFGGTTSSFPALKRNGTALDFRRADDSNYSDINTGQIISSGNVYASGSAFFGFTGGKTLISSPNDSRLLLQNNAQTDFERLQFGGTTSLFPALQIASSNAQTGLAATFTNGSANIITVANTFAVNDVVQFTGTVPTGFATGTNYFIVGTPTSTQTGLTATFTNGDVNITTATNNYSAGDVVQFTSTGILPTGFALATNYYVIAAGLTTTNIRLSATFNGSAITASSAGSGIQTVTRQPMFTVSATSGGAAITAASAGTAPWTVVRQNTCIFTNGSSTVTTASAHTLRVGDVIRFSNSGGSLPSSISTGVDYYILSTTATTFTFASSFGGTAITPSETGVTATFSGTPNITTGTQSYVAGSVVRFTTTGTLPTGLATGTDYYVIATSLSTTNIQVSATLGGSAIAYTGTGSGTHTVTRQILGNGLHFFTRNPGIYVRTADNSSNVPIFAESITVTGNIATVTGTVRGNELNYTTRLYNINSGATISAPIQTQHILTNIAQNDYSRLNFGVNTSIGSALQTATLSAVAVTFVNASANITGTFPRIFSAGDIVTFTNSGGALPTSLSLNTEYYVVGTPNATTIQVATSFGGTAIVHDGAGTGTHTVTRAAAIYTRNGNNSAYIPIATGKHSFDATNTPSGTTGAQTINKPSGTVNFAAGASSLVVTNSLVSTSSIVIAVVRTGDLTAYVKNVVPANGSFTITLEPAATAETSVGFVVFN